jgi:hypothetical protein
MFDLHDPFFTHITHPANPLTHHLTPIGPKMTMNMSASIFGSSMTVNMF